MQGHRGEVVTRSRSGGEISSDGTCPNNRPWAWAPGLVGWQVGPVGSGCAMPTVWRTMAAASGVLLFEAATNLEAPCMSRLRLHARRMALAGLFGVLLASSTYLGLHRDILVSAAAPLSQPTMTIQATDYVFAAPDTVESGLVTI